MYRNEDDTKFCTNHNVYCYNEDTWSRRLYMALTVRFSTLHIEYTAHYQGHSCNSASLQRMSKGTPIKTLLFHGSPDIIITNKPVNVVEEVRCIDKKKMNRHHTPQNQ